MRSVEQHLADVLAKIRPLPPFEQHLLDAHGLQLAEDVIAPRDVPLFDNSAMDGYAVRRIDVRGADQDNPAVLTVVQEIPAGAATTTEIGPGECGRIMTGAPVPPGADAVVPVEWTDGAADGTVRIYRTPDEGAHIRRVGEDVRAGQPLLSAGTMLGARQIGLLAAVSRDLVAVRPSPRVVIISTGSELVEPGTEPGPGQIPDTNGYTLAAAAREAGAVVYRVGVVADDAKLLLDTIEDQLIRADLIVTTGGVSVGAYDVVKEALSGLGTVEFGRVAMQPGMPQGFGVLGPEETPIFTLPGNPVSAYVGFELFVRPAIRKLSGRQDGLHRPVVEAVCLAGFKSPAGKRQFVRGVVVTPAGSDGRIEVRPVGGSGSHLMGGLAQANCLIAVPEDQTRVEAGDVLPVILLDGTPPETAASAAPASPEGPSNAGER
ncbi:molybdopterin molybdotransferase MoeA [Actinocrinis puniceicyclus]|uniref:Molybdopterin molybdenumtransferase n=2 Tax=Actinocrinis puniceicyclus TaxID=977794 RepID=A0A8J7WNF3_9ACTN|nr:molybdopterin molybdotransferase MoeA [Actinocrinis puniceicyclus]